MSDPLTVAEARRDVLHKWTDPRFLGIAVDALIDAVRRETLTCDGCGSQMFARCGGHCDNDE